MRQRSRQAFTSVFAAMYKMPPGKYRENEKFYPLQLRFQLKGTFHLLNMKEQVQWEIEFATEDDIPCWMDLVRLVIDGFPYWDENEYISVLKEKIATHQAVILKDGEIAVGIMLFSYDTKSIDFMGSHPLFEIGVSRKHFWIK